MKYVPVFCGHEALKIAIHKHVFQLIKSIETCVGNEFEKKQQIINNSPKSLNKIHYHILVKLFNIICLSAMLPGLTQIQMLEQDVSTAGTSGLTGQYREVCPAEETWVTQDLGCSCGLPVPLN